MSATTVKQREMIVTITTALKKAAEGTVWYVATGNVMKRELAEEYGVAEEVVAKVLASAAVKLVDAIKEI